MAHGNIPAASRFSRAARQVSPTPTHPPRTRVAPLPGAANPKPWEQRFLFNPAVIDGYLDSEACICENAHHYHRVPEFEERLHLGARLEDIPNDVGLEARRVNRHNSRPTGASAVCCFKSESTAKTIRGRC